VSPLVPRRRAEAGEAPPIPAHPYRDTAILHLVLGAVICLFALVTGGDLVTAAVVAMGYVVVATLWSWWRFAQRIRAARVAAAAAAAAATAADVPGAGTVGTEER
jgi:hypothetical protein